MTAIQTNAIARLRIDQALESMTDAFALLDRSFCITYMNPAAQTILQVSLEQAVGRTYWDLWPGFRGGEAEHRYRLAMLTGETQHFHYHYSDHSLDLWFEIHAYASEPGVAIYFRDITALKTEQARMGRIERAYQAALSNTPDLVYVFNLKHQFIYANEALLTMWGRSSDEAIGKTCLELGYPDWHAAMHDREIEQVVATQAPIRGEVPFTGTNGRRIYEYIFVPVLGENGEVESVAGTTRDVTERQQAEETVRSNEERLRLALVAGKLATWDWDLATGEVVWGSESESVFGRPTRELSHIDICAAAIYEPDRASTMTALQRAIDEKVEYNHEFRVVWPDGSIHWLGGRGKVFYNTEGRPLRLLGLNWDVTARRIADDVIRNERTRLFELLEQAPAFMAVLRGPDHIIERTNALYQELIGGRPVTGKPVRAALPEAADQGFISLLERVYHTGNPSWPTVIPSRSPAIPASPPNAASSTSSISLYVNPTVPSTASLCTASMSPKPSRPKKLFARAKKLLPQDA